MSSTGAVTATGSGGVGWQVDLPSLSSLVLNLGASGLKRFAQAGVDFHTILCMGEIAEKCPASIEYRRELNLCRQGQRKESQIFYKVVEIGSATNFVADELLKKRNGENIIALMSAILPIMSESTCDNVLLVLFETAGAPLDKTPGFGQLRAFRDSLLPLSRRMWFKDKVFQYHILVNRLRGNDMVASHVPAFETIPNETTTVRLILALASLIQDKHLILNYYGLKGCSWTIAYARHILGLPVRVLKLAHDTVPISGDYHSARVFIHIYENKTEFEVLAQGCVQEFFCTGSLVGASDGAHCVDVTTINLLDCYMPKGSNKSAISVILRTLVDGIVESIAKDAFDMSLKRTLGRSDEIIRYLVYCVPSLRKRAQKILDLFGCEPRRHNSRQCGQWNDYFSMYSGSFDQPRPDVITITNYPEGSEFDVSTLELDTSVYRSPLTSSKSCEKGLLAGPAWKTSGLGGTCGLSVVSFSAASSSTRLEVLGEDSQNCISFLLKLAEAAAWLAFTTWHEDVKLLSVPFLELNLSWCFSAALCSLCLQDKSDRPYPSWYEVRFSGGKITNDLYRIASFVSVRSYQQWGPNLEDDSLMATKYNGIIVAQNAAIKEKFDLEACVLLLRCGKIIAWGEQYKTVHAVPSQGQPAMRIETTISQDAQVRLLEPLNQFPEISISTHVERSGENLVLRQQAVIGNKVVAINEPGTIVSALLNLMITPACGHNYYRHLPPLYKRELETSSARALPSEVSRSIKHGLCLNRCSKRLETWLQEIDLNPTGQWLAFQFGDVHIDSEGISDDIAIVQRDRCLECTIQLLKHEVRCNI